MEIKPAYRVSRLHDDDGNIAPQFLDDEFQSYGHSWDESMRMSWFRGIIEQELEAEKIADGPLGHLAELAPNQRVATKYATWLDFMNERLEPWTTGGAIHFRPHWARVLMLALTLGDAAELPDADMDALAMAAVFHDSRRKNPYLDTGHGERAAQYYQQACTTSCHAGANDGLSSHADVNEVPAFPAGADPASAAGAAADSTRASAASRAHGAVLVFDPRAYLAVYWHDRDDDDGLMAIRAAMETDAFRNALPSGAEADATFVYRLLKDADGLDRFRLGEGCFDKRFMRTQEALGRINFAIDLLEFSNLPR